MQVLLTRREARAIDEAAVARLGVPSLLLMENAGQGAARHIFDRFPHALQRVVILGGPGQNGGDGWVVARHLAVAGYAPVAVLVGERAKVRGDAAKNLEVMERLGVPLRETGADGTAVVDEALAGATLVVDALFGTGLDRPLGGIYAQVIGRMEAVEAPVVALDLPSGIDADTGAVLGVAARAELTVTFAGMKRGLAQYPGRGYAGAVEVAHIGVPPPATSGAALVGASDVAALLSVRPGDAHKGSAGHVVLVAGGEGTLGAALLAGRGALRAGAGLATIASRPETVRKLEARLPELMTLELHHDARAERIAPIYEGKRAAVVGPGLGQGEWMERLAMTVAIDSPLPTVIDADALNILAMSGLERLQYARGPRVLTPHPREAARLLGVSVEEVQANRYEAAKTLAARSGHVAVLKGAGTVTADPAGHLAVCCRGTPALGVGGTGDVLAGALGAVLAELPPFDAAIAAVYLHAVAGEIAAVSDRGLLASEVADSLPHALAALRG